MKKLLVIIFCLISIVVEAQPTPLDTIAWLSKKQIYKFGLRGGSVDTFMLKFHATSGIGMPVGSTAQRPFVPTGWIVQRFNTDSLAFEFGDDTQAWFKMAGGGSAGITTLTGLSDVNISSPSDGQILVYNSSSGDWENETSSLTTAFVNGLNAFGANSTIGNSDNFALSIRTNNAARINITNAGAVSLPDGSLTVGGTTNGAINIQSSAASTRGTIGLSSNNPMLNSATGTWLFQQTGNNMGVFNSVGWFFGFGTTPTNAVVEIFAGTTSKGPLKFNSGPLMTTPVAGMVEFLTDKYYGGITTGPARKEFTLNDAALTSGRIPFATTNGRLLDDAGLSWDNSTKILQLGGTSSSFPGLLRDGASIQVKLADNSANANLKVLDQAYGATTWNGNDEVPTKNAIRDYNESLNLVQGTYTPTLTNSTNLDASTVVGTDLYYQRIGNQVTVWGVITLDVTAATTGTTLGISLPIASSLTALQQLSGQLTSWSAGGAFGTALADATNDRAQIDLMSGTNTSEQTYTIRFTYLVL